MSTSPYSRRNEPSLRIRKYDQHTVTLTFVPCTPLIHNGSQRVHNIHCRAKYWTVTEKEGTTNFGGYREKQAMTDVYLPSNTSNSRCTRYMRTRLRFRWTVTVANRGSGTTNPNQYRMYRTWLHLTTAHDRLRSTARFSTASSFRALVHVQLTRLHRATTASCGTATPGTLYTSPHPLHSTTGVRLINARPTPLDTLDSLRLCSANFDSQRHPHFSLTLTITHRVLTPSDARAPNLPLHDIILR